MNKHNKWVEHAQHVYDDQGAKLELVHQLRTMTATANILRAKLDIQQDRLHAITVYEEWDTDTIHEEVEHLVILIQAFPDDDPLSILLVALVDDMRQAAIKKQQYRGGNHVSG